MASESYEIPIAEVVDETPLDRTFVFPVPASAEERFQFIPGQFITVADPEDVKPKRKKAYSISSSPLDEGRVEVTVRNMGDFGARFYGFSPGKVLRIFPPRGTFVLDDDDGDLLLCGGGCGVTPYRGFVRYLRAKKRTRSVTLLASARVPSDLVFDEEFRAHAEACPWFRYVATVTRLADGERWDGPRGRISAESLGGLVRDPSTTTVYGCGPDEFVDAAMSLARIVGVADERCIKEKWG